MSANLELDFGLEIEPNSKLKIRDVKDSEFLAAGKEKLSLVLANEQLDWWL